MDGRTARLPTVIVRPGHVLSSKVAVAVEGHWNSAVLAVCRDLARSFSANLRHLVSWKNMRPCRWCSLSEACSTRP